MEKTTTDRLIEVIAYLKQHKIIKSKKDFAEKMGVSPSYITELLHNRIKVSAKHLQTFFDIWGVNSAYILGNSDEILASTPSSSQSLGTVSEPVEDYSHTTNQRKLSPTSSKILSPALSPTPNLGMPEVVTVDKSGKDNVVMIPVKARAGYLLGYGDREFISELPTYHLPNLQGGTFRAFEVDGHSMTPTLSSSDIVIAEWVDDFDHITDDRVYVIVTKDEGILVKRVLNRVTEYGFIIAKSDSIENPSAYPNIQIRPDNISEVWYVKSFISSNLASPYSLYHRMNDLEAELEYLKSSMNK